MAEPLGLSASIITIVGTLGTLGIALDKATSFFQAEKELRELQASSSLSASLPCFDWR